MNALAQSVPNSVFGDMSMAYAGAHQHVYTVMHVAADQRHILPAALTYCATSRYPSETQPTGTYRWGSCNIVNDGNGKDSRLVLRGNGVTCLILERGESGSPFFEKSGDQRYIRAVESHGETVNDVEIDVGTELDKVNYDFVLRNAANKPR
jgi:hypothetical protein